MEPEEVSEAVAEVLRRDIPGLPIYDGAKVKPDYFAYSECGHGPIHLWRVDGVRTIKLGDYGICWCDDERERRVVRIEFPLSVATTGTSETTLRSMLEQQLDFWRGRQAGMESERNAALKYEPGSFEGARALGIIETYRTVIEEIDRLLR